MKVKDLSVASYSFHGAFEEGKMDVFGYLESVAYRYHLRYADIWNGFLTSYDNDYLKKVKEAMDEKGLQLANLCCDYAHPWDDDADQLAKNHAMADNCMRAAEILEAKSVRLDLGVHTNAISDRQFEYVSGKFREYAEIGKRAGFLVGPENHWGASRRIDVQKKMFQAVNHPNYGMLLHMGNWDVIGEENAPPLTDEQKDLNDLEMAPFAFHTHFHAGACQRANALIPAILKAGYKGTVIGIEHHSANNEYRNVALQLALVSESLGDYAEE